MIHQIYCRPAGARRSSLPAARGGARAPPIAELTSRRGRHGVTYSPYPMLIPRNGGRVELRKGRVAVAPQRRRSWTVASSRTGCSYQHTELSFIGTHPIFPAYRSMHPIFPNFFRVGEEPEPRSTLYLTFTITTSTFEQQIPTVVASLKHKMSRAQLGRDKNEPCAIRQG